MLGHVCVIYLFYEFVTDFGFHSVSEFDPVSG
jgi:hypothetical protein